MGNRWHMNRIGFVNFWLYDTEIFAFENGRLLLRGQNGSGKSITTQSFIPFILDGDRTPSRLDPFGSSDRRMEYYFLGDGTKEDETGYLFLEFKKENIEQYITIGIGQRAQKGKPMDFWGFIILDGRRAGYDFELYRKIGSKNIPYTKQELKNTLLPDNIFCEAQKEYMSMVNKHIFGFPKIEQYDQFIRLLIKVRAPKLTKELKPTKVYEILNDSLQALSDGDLRAMVDAMEKMDDIQVRLDGLKTAYKDIQSIRNEYGNYNRYMLGRKAAAYLEMHKSADGARQKFKDAQNELDSISKEQNICQNEINRLRDLIELLGKQRDALDVSDIEDATEKLAECKERRDRLNVEKDNYARRINERKQKINILNNELRELKNKIEGFEYEINSIIQDMDNINEILKFTFHGEALMLEQSQDFQASYSQIEAATRELENAIKKGEVSLKALAEARRNWDEASEELNKLSVEKELCYGQLNDVEDMEAGCRDEIVESFYIASSNNKELPIDRRSLELIVSGIKKYSGPRDLGCIRNIYEEIRNDARRKLIDEENKKRWEISETVKKKNKVEKELNDILAAKDPAPPRSDATEEARKILKNKNIRFMPFYEAVEFSPGKNQEAMDLLEEQLKDSGLLDSLVVPPEDYIRAKKELSVLSDILINTVQTGSSLYSDLSIGTEDEGLSKAVKNILSCFCENDEEGAFLALKPDGYFKNGILEGHSVAKEPASYVGHIARKNKKIRLIEEKQHEIEELNKEIDVLNICLNDIKSRITVLDNEYESLPKFDDLDEAIDMRRECSRNYDDVSKKHNTKLSETEKLLRVVNECRQKVIESCKSLPYARTEEAYGEAYDGAVEYKTYLSQLMLNINNLKNAKIYYDNKEEWIKREEEQMDDDFFHERKAANGIAQCETEEKQYEEFLNNPENKEKANKLKSVMEEIDKSTAAFNKRNTDIAVLNSKKDRIFEDIRGLSYDSERKSKAESKLREYFTEELSLGLIIKREEKSIFECAVEATAMLRETDKNKSVADTVASLNKAYQQHSGSLVGYGTYIEDCFEDDSSDALILRKRQRIVSTWRGQVIYLEEFYNAVKHEIESYELLILEKDRELFEDILADTLSRKLSARIAESRRWVNDMSALMKDMKTSMALTFSLDWKARRAEGEEELDTLQLEKLLNRDRELLTSQDIESVSMHFRSKVRAAKEAAEENGDIINYLDLVRDALDYRKWFEFRMYYYLDGEKKELTNSAFNRFSGGEKAMAMYVPLFTAVNAQYKKTDNSQHPRIIALDEAFAGVDEMNISSMFQLVHQLGFDYIMNSQSLWGCYEAVDSLKIAELLRPANSNVVTAIHYTWNGREKILDK